MTKKSKQKFEYLKNEKSFYGEKKNTFHHFKGLSVAKNRLKSESAPLKEKTNFSKHTLTTTE